MLARVTLVFLLLAAKLSWPQVEPGATGDAAIPDNDTRMMTPPPVSGLAYPDTIGSEIRTNYLSTSLAVNGGYVENVLPSETATPVNDATFSIISTLAISRSTPRQQETVTYSPSFIFYQPTSVLDTVNQGATVTFQDRLSPRLTLALQDSFFRTSDVFDQSYLFSGGGITGSTQTPTTTVIDPFAEELRNIANAVITYQFGRNAMVGGGGSYSILDFPGSTGTAGIANSNGSGASAFYNRRLSSMQYIGFAYQYSRTIADLVNKQSEMQTHSLLPFYTIYFTRTFSFSVSAGVQHVDVTLPPSLTYISWSPSAIVSVGWQIKRANLAANYIHTKSSGEGLIGAYTLNGFGASGGWKVARSWIVGLSANYSNTANVTPELDALAGGTTIAGQALVTHSLGDRFTAGFGYERLHQEYPSIKVISENPDSNQEYGRITYHFGKALGR
jgi:hypothetical protein